MTRHDTKYDADFDDIISLSLQFAAGGIFLYWYVLQLVCFTHSSSNYIVQTDPSSAGLKLTPLRGSGTGCFINDGE